MGTLTLDLVTHIQTRDENLNRLLGLPEVDTSQPFVEFLTHVHPADRALVHSGFDQSSREKPSLALEFRVLWPDGTIRWLP